MADLPPPPPGVNFLPDPPAGVTFADTGPSVMRPEPMESKVRRIGATVNRAAVGVGVPLAATAVGGALGGPAGAVAGAALGGAAAPYAETAAGRAFGEADATPSWRTAAKNALINAAFTGAGELLKPGGAAQVAPEMAQTAPTVKNLKQAVRNRDFWKSLGLSDEQATAAMAAPDAEQFYARTVESAQRTKAAYQTVINNTRAEFNTRYTDALGEQANQKVALGDLSENMGEIAEGRVTEQAQRVNMPQHELTPTFKNFLKRKASELMSPSITRTEARVTHKLVELPSESPFGTFRDVETGQLFEPGSQAQADQLKANYSPTRVGGETGVKIERQLTVQQLRALRTELRENLPTGATNLDRQAYNQLNDLLTKKIETGMRDAGASEEQIGRLRGIDADYARFIDTMQQIDPRSEQFGQTVNSALWDKSVKNPDQAANFIRMAKAAAVNNPNVMSDLRSSFLEKAVAETRVGAQPMDEMKALQALQKKWGGEKGTQVVLNEMFGKDSVLSNPTTLAKLLATPVPKEQMNWVQNFLARAANAPYIVRAAVIGVAAGGGMMSIYQHPERAPEIVAALAGLAVGAKVLGKLDTAGQAAYVRFRLNPSETNFKSFMRASGAMIGANLTPTSQTGSEPAPPR